MSSTEQRWAFLSVQDKTGIVDFALALVERGYKLLATKGTRTILQNAGVEVASVSDVTGFPVILGGIVKSIHPLILSGILVDRQNAEALEECEKFRVPVIDVVAMNFAGFKNMQGKFTQHQIAPMAVIRAAAANYNEVVSVTQPRLYPRILEYLKDPSKESPDFRKYLAREAWDAALHYDMTAATMFNEDSENELPSLFRAEYRKVQDLRYGENPQQKASLYSTPNCHGPTVAGLRQLSGSKPSYNNIIDADKGLSLALEFAAPGAVIIKHAMPVSAAIGKDISEAVEKSFEAEWAARLGAAVACNGVVDEQAARTILRPGRSIDLVIASDFTEGAVDIFRASAGLEGEARLLKSGNLTRPAGTCRECTLTLHHVTGGVLVQTQDTGVYGSGGFHVATKRFPTDAEMIDLEFACLAAKHARSHATVLARDGATLSVASVASDRVEASKIALMRCGEKAQGAVMASDSRIHLEELDMLAEAGIRAIIHSGSNPETEKILTAACDKHDMAMIVTRMRHFSHS